jgi:hypothetical protein
MTQLEPLFRYHLDTMRRGDVDAFAASCAELAGALHGAHHELPVKDPAHKAIVWWDAMMSAFVGVVRQRDTGRRVKLIVLDTISDLKARIQPYAELDRDTWAKLKADRGAGR